MSCTTAHNDQCIAPSGIKWRIVVCSGCVSAVAASFLYAPWVSHGPILCPFRFLLGMPCPGCGLTRSFCAVSNGHLLAAVKYHLFGPLLFAACVAAVPLLAAEMIRRRRIEWFHRLLFSRRSSSIVAWSLMLYHGGRLFEMILAGEVIPGLKESALGQVIRFFGHVAGISGS